MLADETTDEPTQQDSAPQKNAASSNSETISRLSESRAETSNMTAPRNVDEVDLSGLLSSGDSFFSASTPFPADSLEDDSDVEVEDMQEIVYPAKWINKKAIEECREKFKVHDTDSGSPEFQIASLTTRIAYLTQHLKDNPKDHSSTRGLIRMVSTRRRLLKYLKREEVARFDKVVSDLNIRVSRQLRNL